MFNYKELGESKLIWCRDVVENVMKKEEKGLVQIIAFVEWLECAFMCDVAGTGNKHIGDFHNGYIDFGWDDFDEETKISKRAIELNNGHAAMMGILGLMVHEKIAPLGYDVDLPIIGHLV